MMIMNKAYNQLTNLLGSVFSLYHNTWQFIWYSDLQYMYNTILQGQVL